MVENVKEATVTVALEELFRHCGHTNVPDAVWIEIGEAFARLNNKVQSGGE